MKNLLIVDGNSLVNRAFYALPPLTNLDGVYSNAIYGFCNILIKFITENKPDYIAVAFDHSRVTFRTQIFKEYKGTRKAMPDELKQQMQPLKDLLKLMNIKTFEVDGIEADDIIGSLCKSTDVNKIVLSGDRDVFQLVDDKTQVWFTKKGITEVIKVTKDSIQSEFGYTASQVVDLKALMGDASDNIPGVAGIGEKTAKKLIEDYQTLNGVYENLDKFKGKLLENLTNNKETAYLSYDLATIKTDYKLDFDLNDLLYTFPLTSDVKNVFAYYEFNSLLKRENIFDESCANEVISVEEKEFVEIESLEQLKGVFNTDIKFFAYDFVDSMQFCIDKKTVYELKKSDNLFDLLNLNLTQVYSELKHILNNEKIVKITYGLKKHFYLSDVFVEQKGEVFDLEIASYLVHAGERIPADYRVENYFNAMEKLKKQIAEFDLAFIYNKIEMPLCKVLFDMEKSGFCVDVEEINKLSVLYKKELENLELRIYEYAGHKFNIKSPKQLAEVLFDELELLEKSNKKRSTSIEFLNEIENKNPIVPSIIRYRKIQKLNSTYVVVYKNIASQTGNCIHTIFNQAQTSTGRLSSSEPNLQNIPIRDEEGRNLRKLFISRFEGGSIVGADYSQIELRLLAQFSGDETLIYSFNNNIDIHTQTASQIFNIPLCDVESYHRRVAKAVNFGIVYGISAFGLSRDISVSMIEAKEFIDNYLNKYQSVPVYMKNNVEFAKQNGYAKTYFGRIRKINEFNGKSAGRSFAERVAMNMPLQGSASDIIKLAMIDVYNQLKKQNLKSKLILQIHDELIIDAEPSEVDIVKQILEDCMKNVVDFKIDLDVEISSGKTWFDAK